MTFSVRWLVAALVVSAVGSGCRAQARIGPGADPPVRERIFRQKWTLGWFAAYVPAAPRGVLVAVHGYPWPDGARPMAQLLEHAAAYVHRWKAFARRHRLIVLAPAFGSGDFLGYRRLFGRRIDADRFVNRLVAHYGKWVPGFNGRFYLYGHSAGGQFASRYLTAHPRRLRGVVLSAPATYPFPDRKVPWPYGMASAVRVDAFSGTVATGKSPERVGGKAYRPDPAGWMAAASRIPITIVIGSDDIEPKPPRPGQRGNTRLARARNWREAMNALAVRSGRPGRVTVRVVAGARHDPAAVQPAAEASLRAMLRQRRP